MQDIVAVVKESVLDVLLISEKDYIYSDEFKRKFDENLKFALVKRVSKVDVFYDSSIGIDNLNSFRAVFSFNEMGDFQLLIRNFMVIAKNKGTLEKVQTQIENVNPNFTDH